MGALKQYIALAREHRSTLDGNAPAALNEGRERALAFLDEARRLPDGSDEGYEKTSVEEKFKPDFGVKVNRVNNPVNVARSFR